MIPEPALLYRHCFALQGEQSKPHRETLIDLRPDVSKTHGSDLPARVTGTGHTWVPGHLRLPLAFPSPRPLASSRRLCSRYYPRYVPTDPLSVPTMIGTREFTRYPTYESRMLVALQGLVDGVSKSSSAAARGVDSRIDFPFSLSNTQTYSYYFL